MHVLIVGGGIGGSALAIALRRLDIDCLVVEARPADAEIGGAFLTLAPNGINALRSLDLGHIPDAAEGFPQYGIDFYNASGRKIAEIAGEREIQKYGAQSTVLRRSSLHQALEAHAMSIGVPFQFDARMTHLENTGSCMRCHFSKGEPIEADIVIGADGIWSAVRRSVWPMAPLPSYTGIIDCGGWTQVDLPDTVRQQMYFGHRAFFGYTVHDHTAFWFTNVPCMTAPRRTEFDDLDPVRWMETIRNLHADDPAPVEEILSAANSAIGAWPVYDMPNLATWHTDSVCLIGDAAHAVSPSTGQGASLAIEDAATLARCLRTANGPDAAFSEFSNLRKSRAEGVVRFGRQTGNRKISSTGVSNWFRDQSLRYFLKMGERAASKQYRYRVP